MRGEYGNPEGQENPITGITPACAGNTELEALRGLDARDHPRLRGEYPSADKIQKIAEGSPPLARGIPSWNLLCIPAEGITPACAGNTVSDPYHSRSPRDHPRLRGEYFSTRIWNDTQKGSPPLARGILSSAKTHILSAGITPACAGNTLSSRSRPASHRDHPRLRGEYFFRTPCQPFMLGSPPLARGIRKSGRTGKSDHGITPACAGNTIRR